jgi:predicted nuclease with TOPRIM domain
MEASAELRNECTKLRERFTEINAEKFSLVESKNSLQEKLSQLSGNMQDQVSENSQTMKQLEKLQKEIQVGI